MSEPLTLERLAELRRIAEAAVPGKWSGQDFQLAMTPRTVLALLDEIERLRRERETLAAAVRAWDDYAKTIIENGPLAFDAIDAMERAEQRHREALALLDGEKDGVVE